MGRKHCGKRRKCWLPAFSPFPTMFSKGVIVRVVKANIFFDFTFNLSSANAFNLNYRCDEMSSFGRELHQSLSEKICHALCRYKRLNR